MRVAVLASGSGSNFQALLDACRETEQATVVLLATNRADAGAVDRAHRAGVPVHVIGNVADGAAIREALDAQSVDLVVLAGYLKLVPADVVAAYEHRMINIHPALLPAFGGRGMYGRKVHEAVLASGATVSGATVHLVSTEYDRGPIIAQWPVAVRAGDTPETLQQRVLAVEHQLLPAVVLAAARAGGIVRLLPGEPNFCVSADRRPLSSTLTAGP